MPFEIEPSGHGELRNHACRLAKRLLCRNLWVAAFGYVLQPVFRFPVCVALIDRDTEPEEYVGRDLLFSVVMEEEIR